MKKLYTFLTLSASYTQECLEEKIILYNMDNPENPISLEPYKENGLMINFFGQAKNLYFRRIDGGRYYKRIIPGKL